MDFVINHITAPRLSCRDLIALAAQLQCVGVELRNDLTRPLFDGEAPEQIAAYAGAQGVRIVGLSQVYPFNVWSDDVEARVQRLVVTARACGAETISLIPRNDGQECDRATRSSQLRRALRAIKPMLEGTGLVALVEPLGFKTSSLRSKAEAVEAIEAVGGAHHFKLVHDTFHHHLAGGGAYFPTYTGMIHLSGVTDKNLTVKDMRDEHRVLVDSADRLGNCVQVKALLDEGYRGPISFEAFSPVVHASSAIETDLRSSMLFMTACASAH
jgi:2-keto-myo-inositol isomerase